MMASQPALTSPDGSSNRNPPERCPRPLYSHRDSTQERHKILCCYQNKKLKQIKSEVKEEAEDPNVMGDDRCKKEEIPAEISTDPGDTQRDVKAEEEERSVNTKGKAVLEIGKDGQYRLQNLEKYSPACSEERAITLYHQPVSPRKKEKKLFTCSECRKSFTHKNTLLVHQRSHTGEKPFPCSDCGKCFSHKSHLSKHKITHPEVEPFSCSVCGRRFRTWRVLAMHQRVHSSEIVYQCSKCGQGFFKKSNLKKHERLLHRRLKPS